MCKKTLKNKKRENPLLPFNLPCSRGRKKGKEKREKVGKARKKRLFWKENRLERRMRRQKKSRKKKE